MTDQWGDVPPGPDWRWPGAQGPRPGPPPVESLGTGSRWAVVGIVLAAVAAAVVVLGTGLVLLDLLWNGFVYSASAGKDGTTRTAATLVRSGNLLVVAPLVVAAAACTVTAWIQQRGAERGRRVAVWATILTAALAVLVLATAAVTA